MKKPPLPKTTFGALLSTLREQHSMTQVHLARRAGVTQATLSRLEADLILPTWDTVQRLASALGVSTEQLRTR